MPSFPNSVFSAPTRSAGQTIDASHMNNVQDELNAITGGIINGTARVQSSNLSVLGGSTFAGDIACTGAIGSSGARVKTIWVGQLEASSGASGPNVKVTHDANQAIISSAVVGLNWNTPVYGSSLMHSTASNSSRLTFAESTGVYEVGVQVTWSTWAAGYNPKLFMRMNDSSRIAFTGPFSMASAESVEPFGLSLTASVRVQSTADYVTALVQNLGASTGNILADSTVAPLGFWAHRVGA